jgi:hypothetical protein
MKIRVLGSEAACGVSSTNGSNFTVSTAVRVVNSGTTARLVSIETGDASPTLIGTFTLGGGQSEIIQKDSTHEVFAAHAEVLGVGVAITG